MVSQRGGPGVKRGGDCTETASLIHFTEAVLISED